MPTFSPDHGLLSDEADDLQGYELDAEAEVAELVLGIQDETATSGSDKEARLRQAVAVQVNHQVATPDEASVMASRSRGSQSQGYRQNAAGDLPPAHPRALAIVRAALGADAYDDLKAVR